MELAVKMTNYTKTIHISVSNSKGALCKVLIIHLLFNPLYLYYPGHIDTISLDFILLVF